MYDLIYFGSPGSSCLANVLNICFVPIFIVRTITTIIFIVRFLVTFDNIDIRNCVLHISAKTDERISFQSSLSFMIKLNLYVA